MALMLPSSTQPCAKPAPTTTKREAAEEVGSFENQLANVEASLTH